MVFAEDIRRTILKLAEERGPEKTFCSSDVAQIVDRENWRMLLDHVWLVASSLIKEGKLGTDGSSGKVYFLKSKRPLRIKKNLR